MRKIWRFINYLIHFNNRAWKMKHGYIRRGRAIPKQEEEMGGGTVKVTTSLTARHLRKNPVTDEYEEVDRRVVKNRVVTTAFVNDIVDNLIAEVAAFGDYKFHDSGTGTNAEAASDTALQTPTGEARDTGTQVEGAQTYEYKSVATHTYAGSFSITEHGLFNAATAGILMDRTVFAAIGVASGDKIEFTFTIQFTAGG